MTEKLVSLFTGVNDSGMVSAVATIAAQVADALQQVISADSCRMLMSSYEYGYAYVVPGYSTKICDYLVTDASYNGRCLEAMNVDEWDTPWYVMQDGADGSDSGMRANTCKLVVIAVELFQSLTAKAKQAGISIEGVDVLLLTIVCCTARPYMCMHHE